VDWALWVHPEQSRICLVPTWPAYRTARMTLCHDCTRGALLQSTCLAEREPGGGFRLVTATVASCCPRCLGRSCLPGFVMPS
jgi:hypothetical protein